jgi:hypothetical protein
LAQQGKGASVIGHGHMHSQWGVLKNRWWKQRPWMHGDRCIQKPIVLCGVS